MGQGFGLLNFRIKDSANYFEMINLWKRDNFPPVDKNFINKFDRQKLTEHLSSIFNTITT